VMAEEMLSGREIILPSGASVGMYKIKGGYGLEFRRAIDSVKSDEDLADRPTCKCRLKDGVVVTSLSLSLEALYGLVCLINEMGSDQQPPKEASDAEYA